jgi:hypothetical protein
VAAVARDLGLGWATVMAAVIDHGSELIEREDRINDVHAMGVDETAFLRAGPTHPTMFATGSSGICESRLARTLLAWHTEFLAYFTTGRISNGPTEAVNLLIKKILRVGHGFRNFRNYRLRLLLHCGITWQHHTPTPLRGHLPRLAA